MDYCKKCVMPTTRPGVVLGSEGVCGACRHAEYKKTVDWKLRKKEFEKLCDSYRRKKNEYDCIIAVSAGKDSYYQIDLMMKHNMKPLLANVDNIGWSETGKENFENMLDVFGCECLTLKTPPELHRKLGRITLEEKGFAFWLFDRGIYSFPLRVAIDKNVPFIIYGENPSVEYGGIQKEETSKVYKDIEGSISPERERTPEFDFWKKNGINIDEINSAKIPKREEMKEAKLDARYLSYFFNWSGYEHMQLSKELGFKSLNDTGEWKREGYIEDFDQIDSIPYLIEAWLRYPKFGFNRATDVACYWIRDGRLSRNEAIKLVKENDSKYDPLAFKEFLKFFRYSVDEFWNIMEKFWNRELFEKVNGKWVLRNPIWK